MSEKTTRGNKVTVNCCVAKETDHELRELAKLWDIPMAQAVESCIHIGKLFAEDIDVLMKGKIRQSEAKIEMLKAR